MRAIILISILLHQLLLMGQIQNDINIDIRWDNDLIFMKDRYYTNGFDVFLSIDKSKQYKKNYFVKDESLDQEHHITTIGVSHKIYTPRAYGSSRIIRYDRPFAGALYGTMGGRKTHTPNESIYTELQFGILGPYTGAQPIQTEWHEFTNSDIPGGWQHQLRTSVILNYNFQYDQNLIKRKNIALINSNRIEIGTYKVNIQSGVNLLFGHFNHPFYGVAVSNKNKKTWTTYIDIDSRIKIIGFDATLQGSVFHTKDPHTFTSSEINRFVFQNSVKFNIMRHWMLIGIAGNISTPEFINAKPHFYGTLSMSFLI